jgi:hypothetical protein
VIAYAPEFLRHEVEKHLPALAEQTNRPLEEFEREWSSYQKPIRFVPVSVTDAVVESAHRNLRDPNDLPFLLAREAVAAELIISRDEDIKAAGITVFDTLDILIDLRSYSRSRSVELQIRFAGVAVAGVGVAVVVGLIAALRGLGKLFMRAPTFVKVMVIGLALLPLLHGPTRAKIKELLMKGYEAMKAWAVQSFKKRSRSTSGVPPRPRMRKKRSSRGWDSASPSSRFAPRHLLHASRLARRSLSRSWHPL